MAKQDIVRNVTLRMNYKDKNALKFSRLKVSATDDDIYDIALAFLALQDVDLSGIYKIIEREICD